MQQLPNQCASHFSDNLRSQTNHCGCAYGTINQTEIYIHRISHHIREKITCYWSDNPHTNLESSGVMLGAERSEGTKCHPEAGPRTKTLDFITVCRRKIYSLLRIQRIRQYTMLSRRNAVTSNVGSVFRTNIVYLTDDISWGRSRAHVWVFKV